MNKKHSKIIEAVKALGFHTFESTDYKGAIICVSGEHGDDAMDYYGEFRGDCPWINPKLEALAGKDYLWEWLNPGAIALYEQ